MTNEEAGGLLTRACHGDNDALHALYAGLCAAVYHYALSIVNRREDAQDILQDTFVRLKTCAYRTGGAKAYIFTVTRNLALTCLRERGRTADEDHNAVYSIRDDAVLSTEMDEALATLSPDERQLVLLHVLGGLKHRETAGFLHLPLGTVLWRYQRALTKLRAWMKERSDEDGQQVDTVHQRRSGTQHA